MVINVAKTKAMLFGEAKKKISMQVNSAAGRAKRALSKIGCLIKGRQGISVKMGTDLYKSLIRPHLEYAIPVLSSTSDKDLEKLEKVGYK